MSFTDKIRSKVYGWDPQPEPGNPNGPTAQVEDFAAESRAEVSTPKAGAR